MRRKFNGAKLGTEAADFHLRVGVVEEHSVYG
jgi:hypothetical protein